MHCWEKSAVECITASLWPENSEKKKRLHAHVPRLLISSETKCSFSSATLDPDCVVNVRVSLLDLTVAMLWVASRMSFLYWWKVNKYEAKDFNLSLCSLNSNYLPWCLVDQSVEFTRRPMSSWLFCFFFFFKKVAVQEQNSVWRDIMMSCARIFLTVSQLKVFPMCREDLSCVSNINTEWRSVIQKCWTERMLVYRNISH